MGDTPELFLAINTQEYLCCIDCIVSSEKRYIITGHLRSNIVWIIEVDSGESYTMDFEEELSTYKFPCFPTSGVFYSDTSKLYFTGDTQGNVFIRELIPLPEGVGMRIIKKAAPQAECHCVSCLYFDPSSSVLLIGDSSGAVRAIDGISLPSKSNKEIKSPTDETNGSNFQHKSFDPKYSPQSVELMDEYQDGDEVIRL